MGVLYDYFTAASDEDAAAVIDQDGGPAARPGAVDAISVGGIDPIVQLGTLEELLTGRAYEEVVADPRSGHDVAIRDGGERLVVTLTDSLTSALAAASGDVLEQVAVPWSRTEEFWGAADPSDLAGFLVELAGLARRAVDGGQRLYCWMCV